MKRLYSLGKSAGILNFTREKPPAIQFVRRGLVIWLAKHYLLLWIIGIILNNTQLIYFSQFPAGTRLSIYLLKS